MPYLSPWVGKVQYHSAAMANHTMPEGHFLLPLRNMLQTVGAEQAREVIVRGFLDDLTVPYVYRDSVWDGPSAATNIYESRLHVLLGEALDELGSVTAIKVLRLSLLE